MNRKSKVSAEELEKLLGTDTDEAIGKRVGLSKVTIQHYRMAKGIHAFGRRHWEPEEIALLGTDTDTAIAKKLGTTLSTVNNKRRFLNIPMFSSTRKTKWTTESLALLGTMTDNAVAKITGIAAASVFQKRRMLGIAPFRVTQTWSEDEITLIGTDTDKAIAEKLGRSMAAVRMARVERGIKPKIRDGSWDAVKHLPQGELFAALQKLHDPSKPKLTHKHLAELTGYSLSRMQKWMTPGTAQEPLSISTRHHIYLAIANNHHI